jgi:ketosteroid isomerase-like protein
VLAYFHRRRELASASMQMHDRGGVADDEAVVRLVDGTATFDGEEVRWRTAGIYRVEDGRIAEVWLVPLDLAAFDAIWSRDR